jgi:biopolymer transport protein ExbD
MIFARKGAARGGKKPEDLYVNVVNMIDVMMILISFLLMNSAVQTYSAFNSPDLIPPTSRADGQVTYETEVAVTEQAVVLDGELVEPNFKDYEDKDTPLLPGLDAGLKRKLEKIAAQKGGQAIDPVTGLPTAGNIVTIKSDKKVSFKQIQKVMYTCNSNGFDKIEFSLIKEGT